MMTIFKRRWLRFSLRMLFAFTTIAGAALGWVGWQLDIVRQRHALLAEARLHKPGPTAFCTLEPTAADAGYWMRLLGEPNSQRVSLFVTRGGGVQGDEIERAQRLFPEARISVFIGSHQPIVWDGTVKSRMFPAQVSRRR